MVRIARFDDVRLERAKSVGPIVDIQGYAIAVPEWNPRAWNDDNARGRLIASGARHDDRVPDALLPHQIVVFGKQVTLDAAAARRKKKRGVDDVHYELENRFRAASGPCGRQRDTRRLFAARRARA